MSLVIPSIFTAVDKFSAPVLNMARNLETFSAKAEAGLVRSEKLFNRITPSLSNAAKQLISYGTAGAGIAAIVSSGKAVMDYETSIANLSAITGTSGAALEVFKAHIRAVALETKTSSIMVADAFTTIGNNSPQLLKDAEGLAEVTKNSIILAQAAKMELAPAADYLTSIMNQFNIQARDSKRVIDLLAGGMVIGSTDIDKVADAMTRFGGVASQVSGTSLEESVTAIEAISDKMKDAEKIGTQFRNMFLIMSNIKGQDPKAIKDLKAVGVNMDIVAKKGAPLIDKLNELKKLASRPGALEHVFGKENIQSILPLLASTEKYSSMLKTLTQSTEAQNAAQKMADKNNATFAKSIEQLKNKFVTLVTTSDEAKKSLELLRSAALFLANNLTTIIKVGAGLLTFLAAWKIGLIAVRTYLVLTRAIAAGMFIFDMIKYIAATQGMTFATAAWGVAQAELNAIMLANPIGLIIVGVAALIATVALAIKYWDDFGGAIKTVLAIFMPFIAFAIDQAETFYKNWEMISKSFTKGGIIEGLKGIANVIYDTMIRPLQFVLEIIEKITGANWAKNAIASIVDYRQNYLQTYTSPQDQAQVPALNNRGAESESMYQKMDFRNQSKVFLDVRAHGADVKATSQDNNIGFKLTSTHD